MILLTESSVPLRTNFLAKIPSVLVIKLMMAGRSPATDQRRIRTRCYSAHSKKDTAQTIHQHIWAGSTFKQAQMNMALASPIARLSQIYLTFL
jgi:hypothetical protein